MDKDKENIKMAFRKVQADMIEIKGEILRLAESQKELRDTIAELKKRTRKK
jgi:hypothetical protein